MPSRPRLLAALVATVAASAACASSPRAPGPLNDPVAGTYSPTRVDLPAGSVLLGSVRSVPGGQARDVPAGAEQVFYALPAAYEALSLPINVVASDARTIGLRDGRVVRRLGNVPVSRFVTCGTDGSGMERADSYALTLTVLSRVTETPAPRRRRPAAPPRARRRRARSSRRCSRRRAR
jgi:hypothetical protein